MLATESNLAMFIAGILAGSCNEGISFVFVSSGSKFMLICLEATCLAQSSELSDSDSSGYSWIRLFYLRSNDLHRFKVG